jgi:F420-dependent oxidoreductase-like protein
VTHLGLQLPSFTFDGVATGRMFERIAETAQAAEESGFDSFWVMDHYHQIASVGPETDPMLEAYTLLAGVGARTSRISLGAMVTGVVYRNPAFLAKVVTTLDVVSSGRATLGIGAAWNQGEAEAYGYQWPSTRDRMDQLEDALRICKAMFTQQRSTVEGTHHRVRGALNIPQPVRPGGPPIMIGGGGERRTLRLVARYADMWNGFGDPPTIRHKLEVLEGHCREAGRATPPRSSRPAWGPCWSPPPWTRPSSAWPRWASPRSGAGRPLPGATPRRWPSRRRVSSTPASTA